MKNAILLATFAALLWSPATSAQTMPAPAAVIDPVATQLPHISIQTIGRGPAVFLIPGLASPRAVWDGVVPHLARTHRVYLVQINGFGDDDPRENLKPAILEGVAADLAGYIATNKIAHPAIIGHSIGGLIAMMMGARHPQKTGSVMVVDALPFFSLLFDPSMTVARASPFAERARTQILATPVPSMPATVDPGGIWSITPGGRIKVANWSAKADRRVIAQAMYEAMTTDIRAELAQIAAKPFVVLYATGAGPRAKTLWETAYARSPATLVPIADSWHFVMLDQPAAFEQALDDFLRAGETPAR